MDLREFEAIDWDDEEDEDGNLAHCLEHGVDERVVEDVLVGKPVHITMKLQTAEFALVGPDRSKTMWTILFDTSFKRGDWLRPITGWKSDPQEIREWQRAQGARST